VIDARLIPKLRNYLMAFEHFLTDAEASAKIDTAYARQEGYDTGFTHGKAAGRKEGRDSGFQDGYEEGYLAGLKARVMPAEGEDAQEEG